MRVVISSLVNSFIILRSKHPQNTKGGLWDKILKGRLWYGLWYFAS